MALDILHPSLLGIMVLLFGSVIMQVQGFQDYELCSLTTRSSLAVTPTTTPFNIKTPNFGIDDYQSDLNCSLVLRSGPEPLALLFFFVNFDLESDVLCQYDSLCLHGVPYCGNWLTGFVFSNILPAHSTSTIVFKTDDSVASSGFKITVIPQPLVFGQTIQEARGLGSNGRIIYYQPITYSPRNPYTDECAVA